jgi:hypothetical protein
MVKSRAKTVVRGECALRAGRLSRQDLLIYSDTCSAGDREATR